VRLATRRAPQVSLEKLTYEKRRRRAEHAGAE
jgi:hypothetical protein